MSQWFRINSGLRNNPRAQRLSGKAFKAAFDAALAGEGGPLAEFVRPCRGRPSGSEWQRIRSKIYARDDYTCQYCGERGGRLECDHVFPVSRGGETTEENLVTACFACNRAKRDKTPEEWLSSGQ